MRTRAQVTETQAAAILRRRFPRLRRSHSTAIMHSGGSQTVFGCVCGSRHTTSTDWHGRTARHVRDWQVNHAACAARFAVAKTTRLVLRDGAFARLEIPKH